MPKSTAYDQNMNVLKFEANTKCQYCELEPFVNVSRLNAHIRRVHKVEPAENTRLSRKRRRRDHSEIVLDTEAVAEGSAIQYESNVFVGNCPDYHRANFGDQSKYDSDPTSEPDDTVEAEAEENN